jgi:hypothetical protein
MESVTSPIEVAETVLFRPTKKRKIYRQRAQDDAPNPTSPQPDQKEISAPTPRAAVTDYGSPSDEELEGTKVSMSEILRLRKLRKHRVGGVEFRASTANGRGDEGQEGTIVLHESSRADHEKEIVSHGGGVTRRFAKQTGMVGDVDKHM